MGKERGFTLIELMVVIAIIGALIAIVLPRIGGMVDRAREAATATNLGRIQAAVDDFVSRVSGGSPPTIAGDVTTMFQTIINGYFGGALPQVNLQRGLRSQNPNYVDGSNDIVYLSIDANGNFTANGGYDTNGDARIPQNFADGGWGYIISDGQSAVGFSRVGEMIINANGISLIARDRLYWQIPARR